MDRNERVTTELHSDGYRCFEEFLGRLTKASRQNMYLPINLQMEVKELIKTGEDMVQRLQDQARQKKKEQQPTVDGQRYNESMGDTVEEKRISAPQVYAKPLQEDVKGNQYSLKEIKNDVKVTVADPEDEYETHNSSYARSLKEELRLCKINLQAKENEREIESRKQRSLEEELRLCLRELETKESEIESLKRRMAHYSDRRTKQDQRDVEDTLSKNRQSKVEQDFKEFTSGERIDACIKITKGYKEKTDINARRLTCMMFEIVYEYVLATKGSMTDAFKEISKFVIENGPRIGHDCFERPKVRHETREEPIVTIPLLRSSGSGYSRDVLDGLLLSVKESAPKVDTNIFMEGIKIEILRLAQERKGKRTCKLIPSMEMLNHMDDYLKACIKLTWRMVTQAPPLKLEYQTFGFHRDYHKIHAEACADGLEGHEICYLWPGLADGGGKKIILGEVILQLTLKRLNSN